MRGGTGTGKTTLLSAPLSLADPGDRLLLVGAAAELAEAGGCCDCEVVMNVDRIW